MKKTNFYLTTGLLMASLLGASATATAADVVNRNEAMYKFLPSDTVVQNVKTNLQSHGIDVSTLRVDSDAKGVVQLSGLVGSKQDAEMATKIAQQSEGVYAVLGEWRYELAAVPSDSAAAMESSTSTNDAAEPQQ
jgi:hypothetical protein